MKKLGFALVLFLNATITLANTQVGLEQLLSRKGLSCETDNTYLLQLTTGTLAKNFDKFTYQIHPASKILSVNGVDYLGIKDAQVLRSNSGRQLALALDAQRFGLHINKVAVNIVTSPHESLGYYWVAEGSPSRNRAALLQLLGNERLQSGIVQPTPNGNTRVDCIVAG